jgi:hypothetical protein
VSYSPVYYNDYDSSDEESGYQYQSIDHVNLEYVIRFDISFFKRKYKTSNIIDIYCLERIYKLNGIYDISNFEYSTRKDYYGDEVDNISFIKQSKLDVDIQLFLKLKTNKQKIEYVLMKEYNYILPEINNKKSWTVKSISIKNIVFSNLNHFNNLNNEMLEFYSKSKLNYPVCICLKDGEKYRLIDGYHRFKSIPSNSRKINVIC